MQSKKYIYLLLINIIYFRLVDDKSNKIKCILCIEVIDSLKLWHNHSNSEPHKNKLIYFEKKAEEKRDLKKPEKSKLLTKTIKTVILDKNSQLTNKISTTTHSKKQLVKPNLFSAYDDIEESESEEDDNLNDEQKHTLKENVLKIINQNFEDKDVNKKNLLTSIPKGFFDDPTKDHRFMIEIEEEKEAESKRAKNEKDKKKNENEKIKLSFLQDKEKEDKESETGSEDNALNEEIYAMIECAEFLGSLAKKEKKRRFNKINFSRDFSNEDVKEEIFLDDSNHINEKDKKLLNKKRFNEKIADNKALFQNDISNRNKEDDDSSVDLEKLFNTDFRNIN